VLDAIATVHLNLAFVIDPGYPEHDYAFWFAQAFQQALLCVARIFFNERPQAFDDFGHCLHEFRLTRVFLGDDVDELMKRLTHD